MRDFKKDKTLLPEVIANPIPWPTLIYRTERGCFIHKYTWQDTNLYPLSEVKL